MRNQEDLGVPHERARIAAATALAVLIGTQQRRHPVDKGQLREILTELHGLTLPPD